MKAKLIKIEHSMRGVGVVHTSSMVAPANGKTFTLEELQAFVGGNIEFVQTKKEGQLMVVNEEGKINGMPINRLATSLYKYGSLDPDAWSKGTGDCINGDVLLTEDSLIN